MNPYALGAGVAGWALSGLFLWQMIGAKSDIKAEIERCNSSKLAAIAEAEQIVREAEREAADQRVAQLQVQLDQEIKATQLERQKRSQDAKRASDRETQLLRQAQEQFNDEKLEIPDSDACLNAFISSRALRCVLQPGDHREADSGPGAGDDAVCADPGGADGMHTGFSNVTYLDALVYWGGDRDAAIRWNERAVSIRELQSEVVSGNEE